MKQPDKLMDLQEILREIELDMLPAAGQRFVALVTDYYRASAMADRPVSTRCSPAELEARFAAPPPAEPTPLEDVVKKLRDDVVSESNWLYHPRYMGHQVTAPLPAPAWTDALIAALNQSVAVQEMSPAVTMIEHAVVRWMADLAGFGPAAGGTLTSGGTEASFTALLAARAAKMPDAWENGVGDNPPLIICGEHTHYAVTRAAGELGLGHKRAIAVASSEYRMDTRDLARKLEMHADRVMAVVATAGSTATGSFDDLNAIADLCEEHGVWLHVDGAHGASALLTNKYRHLVGGIERAHSLAWDPHKMMVMPLSVGVVLVRDQADLDSAFSQKAPYLFAQGSKNWDQGGRSFMCSRRADALKLWVGLQRYGTRAFGLLFEHFCALTQELHDQLKAHPSFEVMHRPDCNILCFRHKGSDELNAKLRTVYNSEGTGWVTTTVLNGRRVLRTTIMNPRITSAMLAATVEELAELGASLSEK